MSVFDAYQEEFDLKYREGRTAINDLAALDGKDNVKRNAKISEANAALDALTSTVKQQEIEARSMGRDEKKMLMDKISQNKDSISSLRAELNTTIAKVDRSALIGGKSGEDRRRMIDTNEKLANQNVTLERLHKTIAETEEVADEVVSGLKQNRETIESIKGKVGCFVSLS